MFILIIWNYIISSWYYSQTRFGERESRCYLSDSWPADQNPSSRKNTNRVLAEMTCTKVNTQKYLKFAIEWEGSISGISPRYTGPGWNVILRTSLSSCRHDAPANTPSHDRSSAPLTLLYLRTVNCACNLPLNTSIYFERIMFNFNGCKRRKFSFLTNF